MDKKHFKAATAHLKNDVRLQKVILKTPLKNWDSSDDVYFGLISSIISQQLSIKAAATIESRFLELFSDRYPLPESLLQTDHNLLRSVGLSKQKAQYVKNVTTFFIENDLIDHAWEKMTDTEIIDLMTSIKGVGTWTVQMILMFVMKRPDVFPVLDLGIQNGMKKIYNLTSEKKVLYAEMETIASAWQPYRTIACQYIWSWYESNKAKK